MPLRVADAAELIGPDRGDRAKRVAPSLCKALPRASAAWSAAFGARCLSLPSPSTSTPKGRLPPAARRVLSAVAENERDRTREREHQFADAFAGPIPDDAHQFSVTQPFHTLNPIGPDVDFDDPPELLPLHSELAGPPLPFTRRRQQCERWLRGGSQLSHRVSEV